MVSKFTCRYIYTSNNITNYSCKWKKGGEQEEEEEGKSTFAINLFTSSLSPILLLLLLHLLRVCLVLWVKYILHDFVILLLPSLLHT